MLTCSQSEDEELAKLVPFLVFERGRFRADCDKSDPFALSLSKGCPSFPSRGKQGFDKLSPNGKEH